MDMRRRLGIRRYNRATTKIVTSLYRNYKRHFIFDCVRDNLTPGSVVPFIHTWNF